MAKMKNFCNFLVLLFLQTVMVAEGARDDWPELVLDERALRISWIAANLSALAYARPAQIEQWAVVNDTTGDVTYNHPDYDFLKFYTEEPDQAIVAKKEGRCYLAFRGTEGNIDDWLQNADIGDFNIFKDNDVNGTEFCEGRRGFADFLFTDAVIRGRADLEECYLSCTDKTDCLVITGHSQGGATSTVAAILLYSLNPVVVTFGQPPTVDGGCPYINNERFYRYVNWVDISDNNIGFDLVVYAPSFISGSEHYGYNILVGTDPANVYIGGFGNDVEFDPSAFDMSAEAHSMSEVSYSYQDRIANLYKSLPNVGLDGYVEGTTCEGEYGELCQSGSCNENKCIPVGGITETCVINSCEKDSDCAGDLVCIYDACATGEGEVQPGCPCKLSEQCENNDCATINALKLDFRCATNTTSDASFLGLNFWAMVATAVMVHFLL